MIKLTIHTGSTKSERHFNQNTILIGSENSNRADLRLKETFTRDNHIKIQEQGGAFTIINEENDPFVSLNGLPFGKGELSNNDLIHIGNTTLHFEGDALKSVSEVLSPKSEATPLNPYNLEGLFKEIEIEKEKEKEKEKETQNSPLAFDALIQQVEYLDSYATSPSPLEPQPDYGNIAPASAFTKPPQAAEAITPPKEYKHSIKDSYLSELEDDGKNWPQKKKDESNKFPRSNWNWMLITRSFLFLFLVLFLVSYLLYFKIEEKHRKEVIKVSGHVSDVVMSLTYAHIKQAKPQNQAWSDPEFLKNQLMAILGNEYNPSLNMDLHGQFNDSSFLLRIYTTSDLSRFLVIAQPEPSLWHWIFPRLSIVVDSQQMELREIDDLKVLNRLLLNPLESLNPNEVSQIVKQGKLIPLSQLASHLSNQGFTPPKALSFIRPGAENIIYNAPRYYRFGEVFMKKALLLTESQASVQEVESLQQEMKELSKNPDIVLYSSHGMQWATQAKKAINTILADNTLMVAYLKINSKGTVISSHMVMDEGRTDEAKTEIAALAASELPTRHEIQEKPIADTLLSSSIEDVESNKESNIETHHPLYLQLSALHHDCLKSQQSFGNELKDLFDTSNRESVIVSLMRVEETLRNQEKESTSGEKQESQSIISFLVKLRTIIEQQHKHELEHEEKIIKAISKFSHEYCEMPAQEFLAYVKSAGLESFIDDRLKLQEQQTEFDSNTETTVRQEIAHIKETTNLVELNRFMEKLAHLLNLEQISDPKKLISYQAEIRLHILDKLNDFLLSPDKSLSANEFNEENRPLLIQILKSSWITDPDEYEFYINEFDIRMKETFEEATPRR